MSMRFENYGPIGLLLTIGMLGYSIWDNRKTRAKVDELAKKIDLSMDEIEDKATIDIQESLVKKAVQRAADRKTEQAVYDMARDVKDDMEAEIRKKVDREVQEKYEKISDEVTEAIAERVAAIDEAALKEKVTRKAEDKLSRRLDGMVDGIVSMLNGNLGSANKLRQNITEIFLSRINPYGNNNRLN